MGYTNQGDRYFLGSQKLLRLAATSVFALGVAGCASQASDMAQKPVGPQPPQATPSMPDHNDYSVAISLADAAERTGDRVSAIRFLTRAIQEGKGGQRAWVRRGELLLAVNAPDAASANYRDALAKGYNDAALYRGYGNALIKLGQPKAALEQFDAALSRQSGEYRTHSGRGVALDMLNRHDEAQAAYQKALGIAPGNLSVQNNLALSYALSGRFDEAVGLLESVHASGVADVRHRQNLALLYGLMGRTREAAGLGMKDLNESQVKQNLALYATLRDRYEAYQLANAAPAAAPVDAPAPAPAPVPGSVPARAPVEPPATQPSSPSWDLADTEAEPGVTAEPVTVAKAAVAEEEPRGEETATEEPKAAKSTALPWIGGTVASSDIDRPKTDAKTAAEAGEAPVQASAATEDVAAASDNWALDLGTYNSRARASQTWLRVKARLPQAFDGVAYQIEGDGGEARLVAGSGLTAAQAGDICAAVTEIGYACETSPDAPAVMAEAPEPADEGARTQMTDTRPAQEAPKDAAKWTDISTDDPVETPPSSAPPETVATGTPAVDEMFPAEAKTAIDAPVLDRPAGAKAVLASDTEEEPVEKTAEAVTEASTAASSEPDQAETASAEILSRPPGGQKKEAAAAEHTAPPIEKTEQVAALTPVPPVLDKPADSNAPAEADAATNGASESRPPVEKAVRGNDWGVDLGTFNSQADADMAWLRMRARQQTLFAGLNRRIEDGDAGIRLMVGSVRSHEQAKAICRALTTSQNCAPREF